MLVLVVFDVPPDRPELDCGPGALCLETVEERRRLLAQDPVVLFLWLRRKLSSSGGSVVPFFRRLDPGTSGFVTS